MDKQEYLKAKLDTLPLEPGCYLMKDADGTIIYVGKAKKLKNRVNQYFHGVHNYKTSKMVANINDFEYIVTSSEKEALILENNLIKKHRPQYNILMMDDKTYPYLKLSKEANPRFSVVRHTKDKKARYFGPFCDSSAAYDVMKLINRLYPLRKCEVLPKKACLYYHLGQCLAPCINVINDYDELIKEITVFLNGDTKSVIKRLENDMQKAASSLDFEKAKNCRDLIASINHVMDPQKVEMNENRDFDVFAYFVDNGYIAISGLMVRRGKLLERQIKIFEIYDDANEVFQSYLMQYYENNMVPKELYLPSGVDGSILEEIYAFKVNIPLKGEKLRMVELAHSNALIQHQQKFAVRFKETSKNAFCFQELAKLLQIDSLERIEMFDNSHLSGTNRVSGMIVLEKGEFNPQEYRKFNIKGDALDDIGMMKEVIYRRYLRLLQEQKPLPSLILMDGGMAQINAAKSIIEVLDLDIPIFGLAKDDKHNTAKLIDANGRIIDVKRNSDLFFYLTRLQDEVHRFAITFHQAKRSLALKKSILDEIKGIGDSRKKLLYNKFKSIKGIRNATLLELEEVLPKNTAHELYEYLLKH